MKIAEDILISIKSKMEDFEINISDLKSPTRRFVQSYFERLVMEFGIDPSGDSPMTQEQCDEFTSFNSIRQMLPFYHLFAAVQYIGKNSGLTDDFSVSDLTNPDPQHTLVLLNMFDWFHVHADFKAQETQDAVQEIYLKKKNLEQLQAQVEKIKETIANENEECTLIGVYRKEIEEENNMIVQTKKELEALEERIAVKPELEKLNTRYNERISRHSQLEENLKNLQSQLVPSPEINNLEAKLKKAREKRKSDQQKKHYIGELLSKKAQQYTMKEKLLPSLEQRTEYLQSVFELLKKHEMGQEGLCAVEEKRTTKLTEIQKLRDQKSKQIRLEQIRQKEMANRTELKEIKSSYNLQIQENENEISALMKEKEDAELHVEDVRYRTLEVEEKFSRLLESNDEFCDKFDSMFEKKCKKDIAELKKMGLL